MSHGFEEDKTKSSRTIEQMIGSAVAGAVSSMMTQINGIWNRIYPIGSIYISTSDANPAQLFGGTWEAYGAGKVLVGFNSGDSDFNQIGKTGGSKSQDVRIDYQHKHEINVPDAGGNISPHIYKNYTFDSSSARRNYVLGVDIPASAQQVEAGKLQDIPVSAVGNMWETATGGSTMSNTQTVNKVQPYITVRMWRRVA